MFPWGSLSIRLVCWLFFFSLFFSALICAAVWQVNGAQHQTPQCDLQSDLTKHWVFVRWCYADRMFELLATLYPQLVGLLVWLRCVFVVYMNDCIMSWTGIFLWSSKNWFVISQNVYVCLMFLAWSHEHTVRPITGWFARNQSMIFSPSLNWGGVFLSVPAFLYIMSNIYISLNFKCCQE